MGDTNHDNYAQIKRYLENRLSAKEMHDFEQAMLEDPFLSDAVDGFRTQQAAVAEKYLKEIELELLPVKKEAKVIPMVTPTQSWWKIAAAVIVVAGISVVSYRWYLLNDNAKPIAGTTNQQPIQPADSGMAALTQPVQREREKQADTTPKEPLLANNTPKPILLNKNDEVVTLVPKSKPANMQEPPAAMPASDQTIAMLHRTEIAKTIAKEQVSDSTRQLATARMMAMENKKSIAQPGYLVKGKVLDETGEPVAFAQVVAGNESGTITDNKGNFSLTSKDSLVNVTISSIGFDKQETTLNPGKANVVSLKPSEQSLSEVVVTAYAAKRKKNALQITIPVNGWADYYSYLDRSLAAIKDTGSNYKMGVVKLSFLVNKKGVPANISVQTSTLPSNNLLAIKLLQNGPLWKFMGKKAKGYLTITF